MCLAIPGRVIAISPDDDFGKRGQVDFDGVLVTVNLAFVPEVKEGDYVIVHVGFAISRLNEVEAMKTLACFRELGEL